MYANIIEINARITVMTANVRFSVDPELPPTILGDSLVEEALGKTDDKELMSG
jgi:hypothetical protein